MVLGLSREMTLSASASTRGVVLVVEVAEDHGWTLRPWAMTVTVEQGAGVSQVGQTPLASA